MNGHPLSLKRQHSIMQGFWKLAVGLVLLSSSVHVSAEFDKVAQAEKVGFMIDQANCNNKCTNAAKQLSCQHATRSARIPIPCTCFKSLKSFIPNVLLRSSGRARLCDPVYGHLSSRECFATMRTRDPFRRLHGTCHAAPYRQRRCVMHLCSCAPRSRVSTWSVPNTVLVCAHARLISSQVGGWAGV